VIQCSCSRPIRDSAFLCRWCTEALEKLLAEIPALASDLDTTWTRTSRTGGRGLGIVVRSADRPVPWDDRASRIAKELKAHLVGWANLCQEFRIRPEGPACRQCSHRSCAMLRSFTPPADTAESLARYLLASLPALRHRPEVTECADQLAAVVGRAEAVIDRPAEQTFFGPCGAIDYWPDGEPILCAARCPADLYGPEKATEVTCESCGAPHNVTTLRAFLLGEAQDQLVTAADLSKFLSAYGEPLTADRIRKWSERGLLVAHGKDRAGRPTYRVSEAVDRLSQMNATRRAQSA